jgi:crotonobetainyl-CoA:carnitine CoA-transferase CaiB-like acyl-CoA transferase
VASHRQIAARGLVVDGRAGVEVRPAVPMRADWRKRDAPGLGEHTAEILSELGVDGARLASLQKDGVV